MRRSVPAPEMLRGARTVSRNPLDEVAEVAQIIAQERLGRSNADIAIVGNQVRRELDIGFDRIHHRGVAEAKDALQVLLSNGSADSPRRGSDDAQWLTV